jgi:trehalose 6-phosphate synthase
MWNCSANEKFTAVVAASSQPDDYIWVHDYHLMLQASLLKQAGVARRTGFFLHIPFPPADIFLKLPWRKQLVDALLDYDLLGFQTLRDRFNFFDVVKRLYPKAAKRGRGAVASLTVDNKKLRVGTFPISIDYSAFSQAAQLPQVQARAKEIRSALSDRFLIFGVDRLDYTKGIPQRLNAFRAALERYPELHEKACLAQVLVPSREEVPQYQAMKVEIERMVGELNGRFATPAWTPVHYMYRSLNREELTSYYRAADMALITPLRDGMNLVAKEYAACSVDERGILCLSEFAGAAMEFHNYALMINPFDTAGVAEAIYQSINMSITQRRNRMRRIRAIVRQHDIFHWVDSFLMAALSKHLNDFPTMNWEDAENAILQGSSWTA